MQTGEFLIARLALPAGVASTFRDNDAILLSKDDPNVRFPAPFRPASLPSFRLSDY
jgi:hypothetical protein